MPLMDKFTKIAQSVSNGASTVAKKSNELLETTKLNISIQTELDKIKAIKTELGNKVFEKYNNNEDIYPDLIQECNEIRELLYSIETIKQKIVELKNTKLCTNCNSEIDLDASFCPKCGSEQNVSTVISEIPQPNIEEKTCPQCKSVVSQDTLYCTSCGTSL